MKYKVYICWVHTPEWTPHNWNWEEWVSDDIEKALEDIQDKVENVKARFKAKITEIKIEEVK